MLPRCILYSPPHSSRSFWRDNARLVKQRLRSWKAGEDNELWIEVCNAFSNPRARNNYNPNDDLALHRSNAFCACRAIQDGQLHKALQFLASCGVTSVSDEVYAEFLAKHPQSPPPPIPPFPTPDPLSVQDLIVQKCVFIPHGHFSWSLWFKGISLIGSLKVSSSFWLLLAISVSLSTHFVLAVLQRKLSLSFVALPSRHCARKLVEYVQLLLGRCCVV